MMTDNIFDRLPDLPQHEEIFELICKNNIIKIERIISSGQRSPDDFWYEQEWNEFVIILKGSAEIMFSDRRFKLKTGDYVNIPAMEKHRVESTDQDDLTIWLAVHYQA